MDLVIKPMGGLGEECCFLGSGQSCQEMFWEHSKAFLLSSLLFVSSWLSSTDSLTLNKKSQRTRRHPSFLYVTTCPDTVLNSGDRDTVPALKELRDGMGKHI